MKIHRLPVPVVLIALALLCLSLSGCGSTGVFRTLFTNVSAADAEFSCVKSGPAVSTATAINPEVGQIASLLEILGQENPLDEYLGVMMPCLLIGETQARWIVCTDKFTPKCKGIPLNAKVQFSGKAPGPGLLWKPTRLTAENFDD